MHLTTAHVKTNCYVTFYVETAKNVSQNTVFCWRHYMLLFLATSFILFYSIPLTTSLDLSLFPPFFLFPVPWPHKRPLTLFVQSPSRFRMYEKLLFIFIVATTFCYSFSLSPSLFPTLTPSFSLIFLHTSLLKTVLIKQEPDWLYNYN